MSYYLGVIWFFLHATIIFQIFSVCTATAICIDSHFTVTDNNKNQQFVKLPPPLPYFGAKAAIGIQALEVHVSKTSMSEGRIQFI